MVYGLRVIQFNRQDLGLELNGCSPAPSLPALPQKGRHGFPAGQPGLIRWLQ